MSERFSLTPLIDALALFALDNEARRLTRRTRARYAWELRHFVAWCGGVGVVDLQDVTPAVVRAYVVAASTRTTAEGKLLASATVHGLARAVRRFFSFCVAEELISQSPFRNITMPQQEKKVLFALTADEVQRVLRACQTSRDKAIVAFLVDSGVRSEELCKLVIEDVDVETGAVLVHGKGQKQRAVYIGAVARKSLRRYLMERRTPSTAAPLFVALKASPGASTTLSLEPITPNGLVQLMRRLRERSGVKYLKAHTLRRTFAITCLRNGMDLHRLKMLMGHSDLNVLRRYLPFTETDLKDAHGHYGPLDHLNT